MAMLTRVRRIKRLIPSIGCLLSLLAIFPLLEELFEYNALNVYQVDTQDPLQEFEPSAQLQFHKLDPAGQPSVHSATLANLANGNVRAWWFGGSREGARDVGIYSSEYSPETRSWGATSKVIDVSQLASQLGRYVKKIGNPAAYLDDKGRIWLFFVSVSVGGWAGSSINFMISEDDGQSYGPVRRLTTTPFFNVSTLVRTKPVKMVGGIALPVYHEFIGKFGELLILDDDGNIQKKKRLTLGRGALQPVLIPISRKDAVVYLRRAGDSPRKTPYVETANGGESFTKPIQLDLPNPGGSIDGILMHDHEHILLAYNHSESTRMLLSLAVANVYNPENLVRIHDFTEEEGLLRESSYPAMLVDSDGMVHLAWTHNRTHIKHTVMHPEWIIARTLSAENSR